MWPKGNRPVGLAYSGRRVSSLVPWGDSEESETVEVSQDVIYKHEEGKWERRRSRRRRRREKAREKAKEEEKEKEREKAKERAREGEKMETEKVKMGREKPGSQGERWHFNS